MVQTPTQTTIPAFQKTLGQPLSKTPINTLQINLGKKCNLACTHCHVEASPKRTEALSPEICAQLIQLIRTFPQIQTVDLTGERRKCTMGLGNWWLQHGKQGKM